MSRHRNFFRRRDDAGGELDALLDQVQAEILAKLAEVTDLEAGLAEITGAAVAATAPPSHEDEAGGEAVAICADLKRLAVVLGSAADPKRPPVEGTGPAWTFMSTASLRLAGLAAGLSARRLSREDAAGQLRLIRHNLTEARLLLTTRPRASDRAQQAISSYRTLLAQALQQVEELTPRVMWLFADAASAAPHERVPG
jgi:hypothetical protein